MSEMINLEDLFASKVFTLGKMKERLPKYVYKEAARRPKGPVGRGTASEKRRK